MKLRFHELLMAAARAEGFPLVGALDLGLARAHPAGIGAHVDRYRQWIADGKAGSMGYLVRGLDRRADPALVFPGAKSILCVAIPYPTRPAGAPDPTDGPRYARYLQGGDYHVTIAARLERVMEGVAKACAEAGLPVPGWKVCVDTSAVLERSWAALAGLGWIGKNTLLIHPQHGSYLFLGEVLMDQETGVGPAPLPDYCGNCTRCLQSCPTQALEGPGVLDSRKCISYLTLEQRGELELPLEARAKMGSWVAGCDLCQEACPFNTKPVRREADLAVEAGAASLASWRELLDESPESYRARVNGSALKRVKPHQFARNLALALGNALTSAGPRRSSELARALEARVRARFEAEQDPLARAEWARCLEKFREAAQSANLKP